MPNILDRIAARQFKEFQPQTVREFFALRLAKRLGDAVAVRHYVQLVEECSEERLVAAYRRAVASPRTGDLLHNFHLALEHQNGNGASHASSRLLSIKVERRSVSVSIFHDTQLDYTQTRQLSSTRNKAEGSALSFVSWVIRNLQVESAAIERLNQGNEIQRSVLCQLITTALRDQMLPIWEVEKHDLLAAFGYPAPRTRREMRESVRAIWPVLNGNAGILDAAALGLYVETERLFAITS